jgi:hypothetical protein
MNWASSRSNAPAASCYSIYYRAAARRVRSLFVIGAWRSTIISIGLAFVSAIGIATSGEDMGMMSQPIEQSGGKLFVGKDFDHSENARFEVMMVKAARNAGLAD